MKKMLTLKRVQMLVTKRDIRNHGQVVLDQNANLNVQNANVKGDLRVHGKIIQVNEHHQSTPHENVIIVGEAYCELTIDVQESVIVADNEPIIWTPLVDRSGLFDGQSIITIPDNGIYSVITRVYNSDVDSTGSGTGLWINGNYTYTSVNAREGDHTSAMTNIRPFKRGDQLCVRSILNTHILPNHKQCYTFQVTRLC
jgi:hypothetical protein